MIKLVADHNAGGHVQVFLRTWTSDEWVDIWNTLDVRLMKLTDLNLTRESDDDVIWRSCQDQGAILLTNNRNNEGPTSLEATIRTFNLADSLPVVTLAKGKRVFHDPVYAARTAIKVLEYLLDLEYIRGAGRLYAP